MSIKITTESISFNDAQARIKLDSTGKMQFVGESDHKDIELRQTQFGALNTKGGTINDGGGPSSTDVRFSMQSKETGIPGGAFVFRPEFSDLAYLGKDFVRNAFTFKGTGSAAMILNAISANGVRGDANFTVEAHSEFPSLATQLFTVNELKKYKFHGSDGILTVEGESSLSGSQILSASNANNKPAANFEIDVASASNQIAGFQIGIGNNNPISANSELLSYYDVSNSMFDTSSAAASYMVYGALGVQMANNPNVIIENGVVSTNGTISSSMVIGRALHPANAMFENGDVYISQDTNVRVLPGSKFIIQDQQPNIVTEGDTGTVTISDPTIVGGDVIINPDNGGNPTVLNQNVTIPINQVSYWTVGTNIPGTYTSTTHTPSELIDDTGIQIGAQKGVLFDGITVNGTVIQPPTPSLNSSNIKLRIKEGAELHIQPVSQITPVDGGTNISGQTTFNDIVTFGTNTVTIDGPGGHITASGNISSSGVIKGNQYEIAEKSLAGLESDTELTLGYGMSSGRINLGRKNATPSIFTNGHITSSGNISSSGTISASNFVGSAVGLLGSDGLSLPTSTQLVNNSTAINALSDIKATTGSNVIFGNITSSGNISASNNLYSKRAYFYDDESSMVANGTNPILHLKNTNTGTNADSYIKFESTDNGSYYSVGIDTSRNTFVIGSGSYLTQDSSPPFSMKDDKIAINIVGGIPSYTLDVGGDIRSSGVMRVDTIQPQTYGDFGTPIPYNSLTLSASVTASGNISASGNLIATSLHLPNITSAAATDASHYSINGKRVEVRSQLQSGIAADTGWTLELRNTSVTANSLIVANVIGGEGAIITGSVVSANVVATNTASLNFYNIGAAIADDAAFTASIAIF